MSDNDLMEKFGGCSREAYNELYFKYRNKIASFINNCYCKDYDLIEEVVQKTFIRLYEYKFKYKPSHAFSTWLFTVAKNFALNELKRKKRFDTIEPQNNIRADEGQNPIQDIEVLVSGLDKKYKEVMILRYIEDMSFEDIAKTLNKNTSTVKSLARRAILLLKESKYV